MAKEKVINLYIDAEWYLNQRIFLIGYSYDNKYFGQLYGKKLTSKNFKKLFAKVNGSVFCYRPDTGMLEKFFKWKFRDKFRCVNLMKVFKDHIKTGSFKLKGPGAQIRNSQAGCEIQNKHFSNLERLAQSYQKESGASL